MKPIIFKRELSHFRWWRLSPLPLSIALIALLLILMTIHLYNPYEKVVGLGEHEATIEKIESNEITLSMKSVSGANALRKIKTTANEHLTIGDSVCYFEKTLKVGRLC